MSKFYNNQLPFVFDNYFLSSKEVHHYNTRLSSWHAYAIRNVRTMAFSTQNLPEQKFGIR